MLFRSNKNYNIKKKVNINHINLNTNTDYNMENQINTVNNIYHKQKPCDTMKVKYSPFKILTNTYIQNNDTFSSNIADNPGNYTVHHKQLISKDRIKINSEIGTYKKIVNKTSCNFYPKMKTIETFSKSAQNFYTKKIPLKKICYISKKYIKKSKKKLFNDYKNLYDLIIKCKKNFKRMEHKKNKNNRKTVTRQSRNDTDIFSITSINRLKKELKLDDVETFEEDDEIKNDDFKIDTFDEEDFDIQSYIINKLKNSGKKKGKYTRRPIITKGVEISVSENK